VSAAKGFGCDRAAGLVRRLVGETIHLYGGIEADLPSVPSGDSCSGIPDAHHHVYYGHCVSGNGDTPGGIVAGPLLFEWGPKGLRNPPPQIDTDTGSTVTSTPLVK